MAAFFTPSRAVPAIAALLAAIPTLPAIDWETVALADLQTAATKLDDTCDSYSLVQNELARRTGRSRDLSMEPEVTHSSNTSAEAMIDDPAKPASSPIRGRPGRPPGQRFISPPRGHYLAGTPHRTTIFDLDCCVTTDRCMILRSARLSVRSDDELGRSYS